MKKTIFELYLSNVIMIKEKKVHYMNDILKRLTHNGKYANDVCLQLYITENYSSLYFLDYLNITGKELEILKEKCLAEDTLDYLTQTIRFLKSGFLGIDEIKNNVNSKNPIPFINRLLINGEDYESAYENFAGDFRCNISRRNRI